MSHASPPVCGRACVFVCVLRFELVGEQQRNLDFTVILEKVLMHNRKADTGISLSRKHLQNSSVNAVVT